MFFKTLNDEFNKPGIITPYQNRLLERLDRNIERHALDFNLNSAREELFKSILIAHARLADGRGESRSRRVLDNALLPSWLLQVPLGRIIAQFYKGELQKRADGAIESFLFNPTSSESLKQIKHDEIKPSIVEELKTAKALDARFRVGSEFGQWPGDQAKMKFYLLDITDLVKKIELADEFTDAEIMLQEIHDSPFYRRTIPYHLGYTSNHLGDPESKSIIGNLDMVSFNLGHQPVSDLVIALKKELERRKRAIAEQIKRADQSWS